MFFEKIKQKIMLDLIRFDAQVGAGAMQIKNIW